MNDINHIWGPYLAMLQQEGNLADLYYKVKDNRVSPYLELQADNLYGNGHSGKYLKLDVNPYIRFLKIFEPLLSPDDMGYEEFNQALSGRPGFKVWHVQAGFLYIIYNKRFGKRGLWRA